MPLLEGTIEINPVTGGVTTSTGAAGAIFDEMNSLQDYGNAVGPQLASARESVADMARAVAKLIPYLKDNAVVSTTVANPIPVQVTPATGTGGTTAPGAGTGTIS